MFNSIRKFFEVDTRFAEGFDWGMHHGLKVKGIEKINEYLKHALEINKWGRYEEGVQKAKIECISIRCDELNNEFGGCWYYCQDKHVFKDSLTDRETR